ncbi:MAG: ligand-binding sensor domain-containing protein [Saprospiraceae bacterium]|jgi:ligand-binding sensor domain-containing protein
MPFFIFAQSQKNYHNISKVEDKYNQLGSIFKAKNAMVEDSLGYLWIGTSKGLCKYSGSTIHCYTHIDGDDNSIDGNGISYVMLDSDHLIWTAVNDEGVNVFDINGKKVYDFEYIANDENSLLHDQVWGMWEDEDGYVWISYFYGGISRYDKAQNQFLHFTIDDPEFLDKHRPKTVVAIEKHDTEPHTYWLATTRGLVKFNTHTYEHVSFLFEKEIEKKTSESQFNRSKVSPLWCRSMCKDSKGDLWLGTFGALVRFDTRKESSEVIRELKGEILNIVPGVMTYDSDHIMVSYSAGLALINTESRALVIISKIDGASPNHKLYGRMYRAKNGCIYILSRGGAKRGIYKYCLTSDLVQDYRSKHYVAEIAVTDNYVHYHRRPGQVESRNLRTGKKINHTLEIENGTSIKAMHRLSGDSILVGDFYHMYYYHPNSGLSKIKKLSQDDVYRHESVFVDSDGDIWNGRQREGLFMLDGKSGEVLHYDHKSEPAIVYQDYIVNFLEDDEGDIWIATEQGWTIFDKTTMTTKNYKSKEIGAEQKVDFRTINALGQNQDGVIWIGTSTNGLIEWDKKEQKILSHINNKNGLRSNAIHDIASDKGGDLWIATGKGISWVESSSREVKNFGREFGISGATYCIDFDDQEIYAGHSKGYYHVNMDSLLNYKKSLPLPRITGFELYDQVQDTLLNASSGIRLPNDQNFFSFSYGSINYLDSYLEDYQYKLEGVDQKWNTDRGDRKKGYTNVQPGKYEFQVRVKTETKEWSRPAIVKVKVLPAWHQTLWFKLFLGLIILGIIGAIARSYINGQKRELEIDKRFAQLKTMILKSQMNPHFMFNSLNSIRYLFMKDEKEKGLKYITKFAKLLRTTLHHGDQAIVNLEEEIGFTELFIQLEQLRFDDSFTFTSDYGSDPFWKEVKIPPFVIQPIVENAFWHGLLPSKKEDKRLDLSIGKTPKGYQIIVEDNGVGLSAKSENTVDLELNKMKSYGLNIIKERFDLMNKNEKMQYYLDVGNSDKHETGAKITIEIKEK